MGGADVELGPDQVPELNRHFSISTNQVTTPRFVFGTIASNLYALILFWRVAAMIQ